MFKNNCNYEPTFEDTLNCSIKDRDFISFRYSLKKSHILEVNENLIYFKPFLKTDIYPNDKEFINNMKKITNNFLISLGFKSGYFLINDYGIYWSTIQFTDNIGYVNSKVINYGEIGKNLLKYFHNYNDKILK